MATLDELYTTVLASESEKAAFAEAAKTPEGLAAFLEGHGCDATPEQAVAFLKEKRSEQGEMSDDELDSVAGGCHPMEGTLSVMTVGIGCAVAAITSAAANDTRGDEGQILCNVEYYR